MATTQTAKRVTPVTFPMASKDNRIELLNGIIDDTVSIKEIKAVVEHDSEKRQHRKAVVVEGLRFSSITQAAVWLAQRKNGKKKVDVAEAHKQIDRNKQNIRNWCNADDRPGYYWSE